MRFHSLLAKPSVKHRHQWIKLRALLIIFENLSPPLKCDDSTVTWQPRFALLSCLTVPIYRTITTGVQKAKCRPFCCAVNGQQKLSQPVPLLVRSSVQGDGTQWKQQLLHNSNGWLSNSEELKLRERSSTLRIHCKDGKNKRKQIYGIKKSQTSKEP